MLEDVSSVSKKCQENLGSPVASEKIRQDKEAFYTIFRELSVEDSDGFCEYMRVPYANFEITNFYTLGRRHVEFWARVKGSKGVVDENIG